MKTFPEYWRSLSATQKDELAKKADSSVNTLAQLAGGNRRAGISLLNRLVRADENITPAMVRPDIYGNPDQAA